MEATTKAQDVEAQVHLIAVVEVIADVEEDPRVAEEDMEVVAAAAVMPSLLTTHMQVTPCSKIPTAFSLLHMDQVSHQHPLATITLHHTAERQAFSVTPSMRMEIHQRQIIKVRARFDLSFF